VFIEFDGVMANSDVWINGQHLGKRPFGYVSFGYDLTPHLKFGDGKTNVLAVRADNSQEPASRWYAGAGIYRHVRLVITSPVHAEQWGVFVSTPQVQSNMASVQVEATVVNQSDVERNVGVFNYVLAPGQKTDDLPPWNGPVPTAKIPPGGSAKLIAGVTVDKPQLWDREHPTMYRVLTRVVDQTPGKVDTLDEVITPFGIRQFEFSPTNGFSLNGKNFRLYGVCLHHDASAFGAAVPVSVWERRLTELRKLGVNAIRTAHNPPAPEFLDLCDRMGFLVMDEFFDCWTVAKNPFDYHLYFNEWSKIDAADTIRRDRNHPSIILYSVGNEIHDTPKAELAKRILRGLVDVCHTNDPTRPVTQALFRPNVSGDYTNGLADMLDVIGTNYRDNEMLAAQRDKPERKIVGTEQRHDRQTWLWLRDNPSHSGQFLWSGIDYLGESRRWPTYAAGSGLLDRTATPKPLALERQSWWLDKPMVAMVRRTAVQQEGATDPGFTPLDRRQTAFPDWSPENQEAHDENVEVYSNCEEVELILNGKSLGSKSINTNASPRTWRVAFAPGVLKAVGRNNERVVANSELQTAGPAAKIILSSDRSNLANDWDDVACITAIVTDRDGVIVPRANPLITFDVSGPGVIAAVDSADNANHEPFQAKERHAFQGRCFAYVKANAASGKIVLTASAPDLGRVAVTLNAVAKPRP
jgi:beta-galactosidase